MAVATLSALPWMIVEFKKAHYSVHYQGKWLHSAGRTWAVPVPAACPCQSPAAPSPCSMVHRRHLRHPGRLCLHLRGAAAQSAQRAAAARAPSGVEPAVPPRPHRCLPALPARPPRWPCTWSITTGPSCSCVWCASCGWCPSMRWTAGSACGSRRRGEARRRAPRWRREWAPRGVACAAATSRSEAVALLGSPGQSFELLLRAQLLCLATARAHRPASPPSPPRPRLPGFTSTRCASATRPLSSTSSSCTWWPTWRTSTETWRVGGARKHARTRTPSPSLSLSSPPLSLL